ncbi:MAG: hypothetical protein U0350_16390 [Caldilineaceae bacterium]
MSAFLSDNLVVAGLQLFAWLFLRPSAWQQWLTEIDPALPTYFCLAELSPRHWRDPKLHKVLLAGYLVVPLPLILITLALLWSLGRFYPTTALFMICGMAIVLLFSLAIGVGVGIVLAATVPLAFAIAWSGSHILLVDIIWGNRFGMLFGLICGLAMHIMGSVTEYAMTRSFTRQTGSFVIGLLVSAAVTGVILGLIFAVFQLRTTGFLPDSGIGLANAVVPGLISGLAVAGRTGDWRRGALIGCTLFLLAWWTYGNPGSEYGDAVGGDLLLWIYTCSAGSITFGLFALAYILVNRITSPWAASVGGAFASLAIYPILGISARYYALWPNLSIATVLLLLGFTMRWWRPMLFYPFELAWATILLRLDEERTPQQGNLLPFHPVFWDELQFLPLYRLDEHLVLLKERNPSQGQIMLEQINNSRQRWAAVAAQIELDARQLEQCQTIQELAQIHAHLGAGALAGPASALLRSFSKRSEDLQAGLYQVGSFNQKLMLRAVEEALDSLLRELARSSDPYASRFRPIAIHWQQIVGGAIQRLEQQAEERQEIDNPYIVGVPLNRHQAIFVGRTEISARIEALLRHELHPPLLLYGQRRMGKTSLLYNLRRLLPNRIVPLFVDLQGPVALASDHAGFLHGLAREMVKSANENQDLRLTPLTLERLAHNPFTVFDQWLDEVEAALLAQGRETILLTLDEFEALDAAINEKRLGEQAVLGTLRHLIQHRPRFKLLLAGSHTLDEFRRWSSYLINAQVIHLTYLQQQEALQLIERPVQNFVLSYEVAASRRVLELTRGHPYLVQLLCSELVNLKNEQEPSLRRSATLQDVEGVMPAMLERGSQFFADIELHQVDALGRTVLYFIAQQGEGAAVHPQSLSSCCNDAEQLNHTLTMLLRHELLEERNGCYHFQVEAIRRWFANAV